MPPNSFTATVAHRRELAPDYFELTFAVEGVADFEFTPGQFVTLKVPASGELPPTARAYSIASSPRGDNTFDLCIKLVHGEKEDGSSFIGRGSGFLHHLHTGMSAEFMGPFGVMPFDACGLNDWLLLGTGTGISPIKSIAEHLTNIGCPRKIHFYFGVRYADDVFYEKELQELAKRNPNFSYKIAVSRPQPDCSYAVGRLPEVLAKDFPDGLPGNLTAYICGGVTASSGIKAKLLELGQPAEKIHVEGYGA